MTELEAKLTAIKTEKDTYLLPNNIRSGVTVLGVQGTLEPDKPDQTKTCTPTTTQQTITPDTGYELASVTVDGVTSAVDNNIQAGNIKSGVSILGVTGNYSGIDTSDADATADDIYKDKTAYVNGVKVTGRVLTYPISNSNRFKYFYDYKNQSDLTIQQQASNIGYDGQNDWITLQTPAVGNFNRFAFSGDNKLKSAVGGLAFRGKFGIIPENIKAGMNLVGAVGTFSQCADRGISNVEYTSIWLYGPFALLSSGYYKFDSDVIGSESRLRITFTKDTAGDVKLSYKGTNLNVEDSGTYYSGTQLVLDDTWDSTVIEPSDSADYTEVTFSNVSAGDHFIDIYVYNDYTSSTVLEIKLLDEKPITASDIAKGLTGFVNGNKIEGTYVPDIEMSALAPHSWSLSDVQSFCSDLKYFSGTGPTKINHTVDCTGVYSLSSSNGFRDLEEFPTLINTSSITNMDSMFFEQITNLKRIPLFDTSGIYDPYALQNLYKFPTSIEVFPAFDLSGIQNVSQMVQGMSVLSSLNNITMSDESMNNLLYSVSTLNTQGIAPFLLTLARLGYDISNYSGDPTILANYEAFANAGWSLQ